ncbi:hypothetical protein [Acinetobacter schindleri]|uniref:hypothetical protein n=1 Tax=Acinetobacter schindleri TaxID=108981 RepID=UPI000972A20D|nr:hypothetical protein [Acinetobacter schindleri]APX63570.1 hypothetical protein AsACE_CH02197 [Acinetobacter schindleri]
MSLKFTHKPDYFLYAQLFVRHLENYIVKHPKENTPNFNLQDIYDLFGKDFASASTNLEGILNIADEYRVETLHGDQKLIQSYSIDGKYNKLLMNLNSEAAKSLREGKPIIEPDAEIHE